MRIIAGKYKGRKIEMPKTKDVRPTADMVRGAVFNILNNLIDWEETTIMDLCCGTGSFGIEALSRGAKFVCFIDNNLDSIELTRRNLAKLEADNCEVIKAAAENLPIARRKYDIIYIDPPYFSGLVVKALKNVKAKEYLNKDSIIIAEMSRKEKFAAPDGFIIKDERDYGNKKIIILESSTTQSVELAEH